MNNVLFVVNVLAAVLSSWRITELFLTDRITEKLRQKFSAYYLFTCPRCMSVWASIAASIAFIFLPQFNYPFALAWLYLWHMDAAYTRRIKTHGRELLVRIPPDNATMSVVRSEFSQEEVQALLMQLLPKSPNHN